METRTKFNKDQTHFREAHMITQKLQKMSVVVGQKKV